MSIGLSEATQSMPLEDQASRADQPVSPENQLTLRLWEHWEKLRGEDPLPSMRHFSAEVLSGFADRAFVLALPEGAVSPVLQFVGETLVADEAKSYLDQSLSALPPDSLMWAVTQRCDEVIADLAPIGYAETYDKGRSRVHAVLLPFGENGQRPDALIGVVTNQTKLSETTSETPVEDLDVPDEGKLSLDEMAEDEASGHDVAAERNEDDVFEAPLPPSENGKALARLQQDLAQCRQAALDYEYTVLKSRAALYHALSRAYQFYFEAQRAPEAFADLCSEAGIKIQKRAPFTPVVKLIFGCNYDKARLSEYAGCLAYAFRQGQPADAFRSFVEAQEGGIKGGALAERAARSKSGPDASFRASKLQQAYAVLRSRPALGTIDDPSGEATDDQERPEFVLMIARRNPDEQGRLEILNWLEDDPKQLNGIVRRLAK